MPPHLATLNVFGDHSKLGDEADREPAPGDLEYVAPQARRELGVQAVPRFDSHQLKPMELMFVDNKDYGFGVRGGVTTALIFVDYRTRVRLKVDLTSKVNNGNAFGRMVSSMGAHKLSYPWRVLSNGCGSMAHVRTVANKMGIGHAYIPLISRA